MSDFNKPWKLTCKPNSKLLPVVSDNRGDLVIISKLFTESHMDALAHAVACVNACGSMTTQSLLEASRIGGLPSIDQALVNRNADVKRLSGKLNALLADVKLAYKELAELHESGDVGLTISNPVETLRLAIAKIEAGKQ